MNSLRKILYLHSIGVFQCIELIEIVGIPIDKNKKVFNIFTIAIAQELDLPIKKEEKLTKKPISLKTEKNLKFGIFKSILTIDEFLEKAIHLENNSWENSSKEALACGKLRYIPPIFVPATEDKKADFFGLLKNNFFSGSHIIEWFDESKKHVQILLNNHHALEEISKKIQEILPIKLGARSDRLGNFIIQIPCFSASFKIQKKCKKTNHIIANMAINPNLELDTNQLTGIFWREERGCLTDYYKQVVFIGKNVIPFSQINGKVFYTIWDEQNKIICAGGKTNAFYEKFNFNLRVQEHIQRIFKTPDNFEQRVNVFVKASGNQDNSKDYRNWTDNRIIKHEKIDLKRYLKLIQFQKCDRNNALNTILKLIKKHGETGVYIWDPYLSADDLLETVFFTPYANVPIKALSGLKDINNQNTLSKFNSYKSILDQSIIESAWLDLTFLNADKSCGSFHDRFLIFPKSIDTKARAWSLGTSVNSLGTSHHIIQEVEDGQIIADVFEEIWRLSDKKENIIWKSK